MLRALRRDSCGMTAEARRLMRSMGRVFRTRYPGFVFGLPLGAAEVPIFTYHDVTAASLRMDLQFLAANGYRTLSVDEFHHDTTRHIPAKKTVLLTFDDARSSFYDTALPLLQEYGMRATLFVPTLWMRGRSGTDGALGMPGRELFMSWDQLRQCAGSGLVDVHCHAYRHALVYTSSNLVGFAAPDMLHAYDIYDWPMQRVNGEDRLGRPPLGTPIYEATPLLSATRRVIEQVAVVEACQQLVEEGGKEDFFDKSDWRRALRHIHDEAQQKYGVGARVSTATLLGSVESEFEQAQGDFERELGYRARFFAYPWLLGSMASIAFAKDYGMEAIFGVGIDYGKARRACAMLPAYGRLKEQWLQFLPGEGRRNVVRVIPEKIRQFFGSQHLAH